MSKALRVEISAHKRHKQHKYMISIDKCLNRYEVTSKHNTERVLITDICSPFPVPRYHTLQRWIPGDGGQFLGVQACLPTKKSKAEKMVYQWMFNQHLSFFLGSSCGCVLHPSTHFPRQSSCLGHSQWYCPPGIVQLELPKATGTSFMDKKKSMYWGVLGLWIKMEWHSLEFS